MISAKKAKRIAEESTAYVSPPLEMGYEVGSFDKLIKSCAKKGETEVEIYEHLDQSERAALEKYYSSLGFKTSYNKTCECFLISWK